MGRKAGAGGETRIDLEDPVTTRYVVVWLAVILLLAIGHGLIIRGALISLQAS